VALLYGSLFYDINTENFFFYIFYAINIKLIPYWYAVILTLVEIHGKTRNCVKTLRPSGFHTISRFPNSMHSCSQFHVLVLPIPCTVYQHGKCFIFVKSFISLEILCVCGLWTGKIYIAEVNRRYGRGCKNNTKFKGDCMHVVWYWNSYCFCTCRMASLNLARGSHVSFF
jgi:hypothetical protein